MERIFEYDILCKDTGTAKGHYYYPLYGCDVVICHAGSFSERPSRSFKILATCPGSTTSSSAGQRYVQGNGGKNMITRGRGVTIHRMTVLMAAGKVAAIRMRIIPNLVMLMLTLVMMKLEGVGMRLNVSVMIDR